MEKQLVARLRINFEDTAYEENGVEYWLARDMQILLDYTQWRNFEQVIEKAKIACKNSGQIVADHFADVSKTISMPKKFLKNTGKLPGTKATESKNAE